MSVLREGQASSRRVEIDVEDVASGNLVGRNQIRNRMDEVAVDGALEMARTEAGIGPFAEKKLPGRVVDDDGEGDGRGDADTLLHRVQFDGQYRLEFRGPQGPEHDGVVDAVHELGSELASRGLNACAGELVLEIAIEIAGSVLTLEVVGGEAHFGMQQGADLRSTEVAGHEDQGARKVDAAIVAERQNRLVENAKQQVPESVAGFFDFVEKDEAELQLIGVVLVQAS